MNDVATIATDNLPAMIEAAASRLALAKTSGEVLEVRNMAQAVYDATKLAGRMQRAKRAHDDILAVTYRAQGDALSIQARAKARLADEYDAAQERGEVVGSHDGARKRVDDGNAISTAADLGLRRDEEIEARQLRDIEQESPGIVDDAITAVVGRGEEPSKAAVAREIGNYRAITTGENEWYTPKEYVDLARGVMGDIDLDPASCAEANEIVKAKTYYTKDQNGLELEWLGRVWLNPPYSRELMPAFTEKLRASVLSGDVSAAIMVSHNNTDTGWFHSLAECCAALCFPSKRIKFYRGDNIAAPINGQMFMYFGADVDAFKREFSEVGFVVIPA